MSTACVLTRYKTYLVFDYFSTWNIGIFMMNKCVFNKNRQNKLISFALVNKRKPDYWTNRVIEQPDYWIYQIFAQSNY